jgi:hypothetical protein
MDGLLNFSVAFVLVACAVLVLMGKADWMMSKYKLAFKERQLAFVKIREYDARRTRPFFALILFLLAVFIVLEYLLRPLPEWCAFIVLGIILPIVLFMELKCRKKP